MKYIFAFLMSIVLVSTSYSQDIKVDTIYYSNEWAVVSTKYIADYYRVKVSSQDRKECQYRDYYITGEQQGRGCYISIDSLNDSKSIFDGKCITYYKNGNVQSEQTYIGGKLSGESFEYKQDGLIGRHAIFDAGQLNGILTEFDKDNNCIQMEYVYGVPADYYTVSNSDGQVMRYNALSGKPVWLSPSPEEKKVEYKDGVEWQYYTKNGLTICMAQSSVKDYGSYYLVDLLIVNNSLEPIEFDPSVNILASARDIYGKVYESCVLSSEEYIRKVRNRQAWNSVLVGVLEGVATAGAGYTTSTSYANSYSSGNMNMGRSYGSYTGYSSTVSTTHQYNAAAAYQAQAISNERIANFNSAQLEEREIKNEEYLKKTTIYPSDIVTGYIHIDRKAKDAASKFVIDINGAEYVFEDSNWLVINNFDDDSGDLKADTKDSKKETNELLATFSKPNFTYYSKQEACKITDIAFYEQYTKVTFSYINVDGKIGSCSIDPDIKLQYSYMNYKNMSCLDSFKMTKAENIPLSPDVHQFSSDGEELIFHLYFPNITRPSRIKKMNIIENKKSILQWKNIQLNKH